MTTLQFLESRFSALNMGDYAAVYGSYHEQQIRDCPRMGAVPGFCGENHRGFMARKLLGQPPMVLGTVPSLLPNCLN